MAETYQPGERVYWVTRDDHATVQSVTEDGDIVIVPDHVEHRLPITTRAVFLTKIDGVEFPHIKVQLTGTDGNAFAVIGSVRKALLRAGVKDADIAAYQEEATAGDYDNLLQVTMRTVTVL